jgi:hypothetical protein
MSFLYCYKINNRGISLALKTPDTPIKKNEFIWTHYDVSQASSSNWLTRQEEVKGSGSIPSSFGGGEADLEMYQNSLGVAYGVNF